MDASKKHSIARKKSQTHEKVYSYVNFKVVNANLWG